MTPLLIGNCCGSIRSGPRNRRPASSTRRWSKPATPSPRTASGCHGGKKIAGRGRHVAVTAKVVARTGPHSFQVLRRRRVVERTFGWLMRYRRLARGYERTTANSEAMIYRATVIIMTRRLARYDNGQPPIQRRGGERPRPTGQTALPAGSKVVAFYDDRYPASGR